VDLFKALVLGIVQGLTEFLPITSSGHLVIGAELLDFRQQGVVFEVCLHMGTLLSVLLVFRREIWAMSKAPFQYMRGERSVQILQNLRWDLYVLISLVPAVFVGLFLKDSIESVFASLPLVFFMLFITGIMMIASGFLPARDVLLQGRHAFIIGCAQALAILPGLSRSGSTIFAGMALGIDRQAVARFSFIMSIPAICGAMVLQVEELMTNPPSAESLGNIAVGTATAAVTGYFAIVLLLDIVRRNRLQWFGYYCLAISFAGAGYLFMS